MAKIGNKRTLGTTALDIDKMTVADILAMPEFRQNVSDYLQKLREARKKATEDAKKRGLRIKKTLLDWVDEKGVDGWQIATIFGDILDKKAIGFSARERQFINAIGMEAYRLTILPLVEKTKNEKNNVLAEKKTTKG